MSGEICKVSRQYTFDSSHQLPGHKGKCASLHGHTYYVTVAVEGYLLPGATENRSNADMVIDFGDLDAMIKPIIDRMDHCFICSGYEPIFSVLTRSKIEALFGKLCFLGGRTTAENIAKHLTYRIAEELRTGRHAWEILMVSVKETPKSEAEYVLSHAAYKEEGDHDD